MSLCSREIPVSVQVNSQMPRFQDGQDHQQWRTFLRTLTGIILAHCSDQVNSAGEDRKPEIIQRQVELLRREKGLITSGREVAAPAVDHPNRPVTSLVMSPLDLFPFEVEFHRLLDKFNLKDDLLNPSQILNLTQSVWEILENTREHGKFNLAGKPIKGIRFLSLRQLHLSQETTDILTQTGPSPISEYLDTLSEMTGRQKWTFKHRLLEVTISDSGIGIPARLAGTMEIYHASLEEERRFLLKALAVGQSSKAKSVSGSGLGLYKVMRASHALRGLIVFRTGRLCMYRHYLQTTLPWPSSVSEVSNGDWLNLLEWSDHQFPYVAGTSISILVPWFIVEPINQLSLAL